MVQPYSPHSLPRHQPFQQPRPCQDCLRFAQYSPGSPQRHDSIDSESYARPAVECRSRCDTRSRLLHGPLMRGPLTGDEALRMAQYLPKSSEQYDGIDSERYAGSAVENVHRSDSRSELFHQELSDKLRAYYGLQSLPKHIFCIGIDDGQVTLALKDGHELPDDVVGRLLNTSELHRFTGSSSGTEPLLNDSDAFEDSSYTNGFDGRGGGINGRRNSSFDWRTPDNQGRKRQRGRYPVDEEDAMPVVSRLDSVEISDSQAVWDAYVQGFKNCQQTLCKLIAKAWVKAVEPKKQTAHPYTKNDEGAPDWWPKPWGPTKDEKVRHKEPDHLYKRERVHLLCHILRLVVEPPPLQHPDIRKSSLSVAKLGEVTFEAVSSFFAESEANAQKQQYLTNIFKIAKQEERYKRNDIDGSTRVYPLKNEKEAQASDNDDATFIPGDERRQEFLVTRPRPDAPRRMVPPSTAEASTASDMHGHHSLLGILPTRSQFPPPDMAEAAASSASYVSVAVQENGPVGDAAGNLPIEMPPGTRDNGRPPSTFSDYASPSGGNMYSPQWSLSSPQNNAAMYSYPANPNNPQPSSFDGQAGSLTGSSTFMPGSFNETNRPAYGHSHTTAMMRTVDVPHGAVHTAQGYRFMGGE